MGPNAVIGAGVSLGAGCSIGANVTISHTLAGDRVQVFANAAIGRPGFGFVKTPRGLLRVPQLGRVVIGDDVEIGSGCTVDRGTLGDTRIGTGCKIGNGVQIAHNVTMGIGCILAGHVGIAGSATIEDFVVIGAGVVISDHVRVGTRVQIAVGSCVIRDLAAQTIVGGYPAVAMRQWHPTDRGGHAAGSAEGPSIAKDNLETFLVTNESVDVSLMNDTPGMVARCIFVRQILEILWKCGTGWSFGSPKKPEYSFMLSLFNLRYRFFGSYGHD